MVPQMLAVMAAAAVAAHATEPALPNTGREPPSRMERASVATADSLARVSLPEALRRFGEESLELRLARARRGQQVGDARQSAAYFNPSASAYHESLGGSGGDYQESVFTLEQRLEWPGATSARSTRASRAASAARVGFRADSLEAVFEVRRAYVRAAAAEARVQALRRVAKVFRAAVESGRARLEEGDISGYDLRRLRLERARFENALESARLTLQDERRSLTSLLGGADSIALLAPEALPEGSPPQPPEREEAVRAGLASPRVESARAELEAARAEARVARLSRVPDLTVSGGYKTQSGGLDGLVISGSLPLPVFDRKDARVQAGSAGADAAARRLELLERSVRKEVTRSLRRYRSARRRMELIAGDLLRQPAKLLESARTGYAAGEMSLVELLDAADAYREARVTVIDLRAERWINYFDLLRAMGGARTGRTAARGGTAR